MFNQHIEYFYVNVFLPCVHKFSSLVEIIPIYITNSIPSFKHQMILRHKQTNDHKLQVCEFKLT